MKRSLLIGIGLGSVLTVGRLLWEIQEAGLFLERDLDPLAVLLVMCLRPTVWWSLFGFIGLFGVLAYPFAKGGATPAEKELERQL